MILLLFFLFGLSAPTNIPGVELRGCDHLRYAYSSRGVPEYEVPGTPLQGDGLAFCPSGPTCCTKGVEQRLGAWSERQYRDAIFNKTTSMAALIEEKATQIDDYVYSLLNKAQRSFHEMFLRTYGIMYQKNADVFQDYFKKLKIYYDKGTLDLGVTTSDFFNLLYQKMFQVLNSQYTFDNAYMKCVSDNMDVLHPFGDVPRKLASSVKRSLVAARALVRALKTGHEIANVLTRVEPSPNCLSAVKKMSSCPACKGIPEVKPCNGYCINIMKGCLAHHYEVDGVWNQYIESLLSLIERLSGPFNVEMTIDPLSIKISDAIMNFQEAGFQVTQKVFEICGTPRLGRRSAQPSSQFIFEKRLEKIHRTPSRPPKTEFEILLISLKKHLKSVDGFWSLLPYQMCDTQLEKPMRNIRDRTACWNGESMGTYDRKVLEDGYQEQAENPEVPVTSINSRNSGPSAGDENWGVLVEERERLQSLSSQLRAAYRGLDIEWWDDTGKNPREAQGAEEGSGSGGPHGDVDGLYDDEDYADGSGDSAGGEAAIEGSGGHSGAADTHSDYSDEVVVPYWHKDKGPSTINPFTQPPRTTQRPTAPSTTRTILIGSGAAAVRTKLSVWQAVTSFLLPAVTCYIGSLIG